MAPRLQFLRPQVEIPVLQGGIVSEKTIKDSLRPATARENAGLFDLFGALLGGGRQPDIFGELDLVNRDKILATGRRNRVPAGTRLFRQGEETRGIFHIETGQVKTFYTSPEGDEITFAYFRPGNFVGGPAVFGGDVNMWSGTAIENTEYIAFRGPDLRQLSLEHPALAVGLIEALIYKAKCYSFMAQILGTRSVSDRLFHILTTLCELYGEERDGEIRIAADLTHEDLARMTCASRQWVTTVLNRLQKQGILRIHKKQIVVLRPELLATAGGAKPAWPSRQAPRQPPNPLPASP
jgi:CRP/FNR family cyclic AMP-dependent transcriptional regulator